MLRASCRGLVQRDVHGRGLRSLRYLHNGITKPSDRDLVKILLRNKELTSFDAGNELRWIRQAVTESRAHKAPGDGLGLGAEPAEETVARLVARRSSGEPLQYVLGNTEFGPLDILVKAPTLIPRPETAHITDLLVQSLRKIKPGISILDICTGSGCIALLLKHHLGTTARVKGVDVSHEAIELAQDNASRLGLDVWFHRMDIWDDEVTREKAHLVVSNPPYIPRRGWNTLDIGVRLFEDPRALIGDPVDLPNIPATPLNPDSSPESEKAASRSDGEGLSFYRRIADLLDDVLLDEALLCEVASPAMPRVAVEIGMGQAKDVADILMTSDRVSRTEVWLDQYDVERMVVGYSR